MKHPYLVKFTIVLAAVAGFMVFNLLKGKADPLPSVSAPVTLPTPVISPNIPASVSFGEGVTSPQTARPFFDYFSWQSFVALNWPAAIGTDGKPVRGIPDTRTNINIGSPGTRVWESYKADWELFRPKGVAPSDWLSYDLPGGTGANPCGNSAGSKMLVMVTKMDSIVDGLNQAFSGPLIDQNRNYVRYEIHVNKSFYEIAVKKNWYIFNDNTKILPDGVIEIKAAWKELTSQDDPTRYYTVNALIVEPGPDPGCRPAQMGLVGLHIANKIAHFREWVWSTFEHVDNLPESGAKAPFNLNNNRPSPTPLPGKDYNRKAAKLDLTQSLPLMSDPARDPIQVIRRTPISPTDQEGPTTGDINTEWQNALSGTIWANYKLVITQWPTAEDGASFKIGGSYPGDCGVPFPTNNVANLTMETYLQTNNCMKCHYAAANDDFSFLFAERAFRPNPVLPTSLTLSQRKVKIDSARIEKSRTLTNLQKILSEENK